MAPDHFRKHWGFATIAAAPLTVMTALPASAQTMTSASFAGAAPLAIAAGAGGFALLAMAVVRTMLANGKAARVRSAEQIAGLRALVDEYEALLSGTREVTVLWTENSGHAPKLLGQAASVLPMGRQPENVLNFHSWLTGADADRLAQLLEQLRVHGHAFAASLQALDGRLIRANGWVLGGGAAIRLRPAFLQPQAENGAADAVAPTELDGVRTVLAALNKPAFTRDAQDRLIYANAAYLQLARALGRGGSEINPPNCSMAPVCAPILPPAPKAPSR